MDVLGVPRVALHRTPLALWGYHPLNLLGASPCEVPAQHVRAAKFPRAPWERALTRLLAPHPLCLQQVVCNYYLLVDVMEALEV